MITLSWNCRGLGTPRTVRDLCRLVKEKKPALVFLMETKLRQKKLETIRCRIGYYGLFVVDCIGRSGGLALLWSSEISVEIQNYSQHHINAVIKAPINDAPWKFTGFYGHPVPTKRHITWSLLQILAQFDPLPWVCIGDFNEILTPSEKVGGQ
jgi:exonuclease III